MEESETWDLDEFDKGALMSNIQRYRISAWLLRIAMGDGEKHPHLEECLSKIMHRIGCWDGPGHRSGVVLSEEIRAKMARAHLGKPRKPFTKETKAKMRLAKSGANNPMFGRKASAETCALLSKISYQREAAKRMKPDNIIEIPAEFTRGQMGKANRALKRLGTAVPTEEEKAAFCRYFQSIGVDPMQASSRTLAKIYQERNKLTSQ
jgi:hypothetical protein